MLRVRKDALSDFSIDKLESIKLPIEIGMVPSRVTNTYLWLDDERLMYLGGNFEEANVLTVADLAKRQSVPTLMWFEDDYKGENIVKQGVYTTSATIYWHPGKPMYIYASGFGQYLEFFTLNSDYKVENRNVILDKTPKYEAHSDGLNYVIKDSDRYNPQGIKFVVPTEKYLYVMLENVFIDKSGELLPYKQYSAFHNDIFQVYDWEGNYVKNIELELPCNNMAWDKK